VRSRRVSSTHAWIGSWSRRSEISSSVKVEDWVGTNRSGVVGSAVAILTLAAAFFFVFPAAGLVAAVDFGVGFLDPALKKRPLGRRDSSPRPDPFARQRARPAGL
jgi:hypothetical protein